MGVFDGCQVTLELDSSVRFKQKLELKNKVIDNGGLISFIVTKKVRKGTGYSIDWAMGIPLTV